MTKLTRKVFTEKMENYSKNITPQLIGEVKRDVSQQKLGVADHPALLKPDHVSKEKWDSLKERNDANEIIEELEK